LLRAVRRQFPGDNQVIKFTLIKQACLRRGRRIFDSVITRAKTFSEVSLKKLLFRLTYFENYFTLSPHPKEFCWKQTDSQISSRTSKNRFLSDKIFANLKAARLFVMFYPSVLARLFCLLKINPGV